MEATCNDHARNRPVADRSHAASEPVSACELIVPDALNLVQVDREADRAIYREENLWVQHG
jgi:hypothetical protein